MRWYARAARARKLYTTDNAALQKIEQELQGAMASLLQANPKVSLAVRPDAFLFEQAPALEEPDPDNSIPGAFFRDGIRRIQLRQGLNPAELRGLLWVTAEGLRAPSGDQDIASRLWQLNLEHVDYVAVDSTLITDAQGASANAGRAELDDVLRGLYGSVGGVADEALSVHLDGEESAAQRIAQTLQFRDELAPGLFPTMDLQQDGDVSDGQLLQVGEIPSYGLEAVLALVQADVSVESRRRLLTGLLKLLDSALVEEDFVAARAVVLGLRQSKLPPPEVEAWLDQALGEPRVRVAFRCLDRPDTSAERRREVLAFLQSGASWAVDRVLVMMPELTQPARRHELAKLALELGVYQLKPLQAMLQSEEPSVLAEAFYLLAKLDREDAQSILQSVAGADRVELRLALARTGPELDTAIALKVLARLLKDDQVEVRVAAARALARRVEPAAVRLLEDAAQPAGLHGQPVELRRAVLESFARRSEQSAAPLLMRMVREGERLLTNRETDDNAVAAAWGLSRVRSVSAVELLKRACNSRHRRLREAATGALEHMRRHT